MMPSRRLHSWNAASASLSGRREKLHAAEIGEPGVLRARCGIIEAGGDRMRLLDLAVVVHQEIGAVAVQHAGPPPATEAACCFFSPWPAASTP